MKIVKTHTLTQQQKIEIQSLTKACQDRWNMSLSFPFEDGTSFYLLYENFLVSTLALIMPERAPKTAAADEFGTAECIAFTLPSEQNKGYFTALLEAAEEEIQDINLLFTTDESNEGALKTLCALDAELNGRELRMELSPAFADRSALTPRLTITSVRDEANASLAFHLTSSPHTEIGKSNAAFFQKSACLYGFEIEEEYRNQGFGKEALLLFIDYIKSQGCSLLYLHVSDDNVPALRLYEKTGFRVTETLSYYLY